MQAARKLELVRLCRNILLGRRASETSKGGVLYIGMMSYKKLFYFIRFGKCQIQIKSLISLSFSRNLESISSISFISFFLSLTQDSLIFYSSFNSVSFNITLAKPV